MTEQEARQILNIPDQTDKNDIKKRYHALIRQIHPDVGGDNELAHEQTLRMNEAYSYLMKRIQKQEIWQEKRRQEKKQKEEALWDAAENPFAFEEREIFHEVEGIDGESIGHFVLATGKYFWDPQIEEFGLFLRSIHSLSEQLISKREEEKNYYLDREYRIRLQAELAYLLTQQFVDRSIFETIAKRVREDAEKGNVYFMPAMLETIEAQCEWSKLPVGAKLYPEGMHRHRLYLKNAEGSRAGYLSFADDRLYSVVIPMFEQKRARIKVEICAPRKQLTRRRRQKEYLDLNLWIQITENQTTKVAESLNSQIEKLLSFC